VVVFVAPAAAAACAFTVSVDVQVPPGARAHDDAESVDGNTKLAAVPVSDAIESANVELVHAAVSLLVTVAVYVTVPPALTVWEAVLKVTVGAFLVQGVLTTVNELVARIASPWLALVEAFQQLVVTLVEQLGWK
jgi:hypothetical protein